MDASAACIIIVVIITRLMQFIESKPFFMQVEKNDIDSPQNTIQGQGTDQNNIAHAAKFSLQIEAPADGSDTSVGIKKRDSKISALIGSSIKEQHSYQADQNGWDQRTYIARYPYNELTKRISTHYGFWFGASRAWRPFDVLRAISIMGK